MDPTCHDPVTNPYITSKTLSGPYNFYLQYADKLS